MWIAFVTLWGGLGSLVDSALGGWLQASVVDVRSGKVVEGVGGKRVPVSDSKQSGGTGPGSSGGSKGSDAKSTTDKDLKGKPSRRVEVGLNLLDNNGVNFLMAALMSGGGIAFAGWIWGIPLSSILP